MKKLFSSSILFALLVLISSVSYAQKEAVAIQFKVWGNCEMCQKTIETALDVKGVKTAKWNLKTKMLEVVYLPSKISEAKIHQLVAGSGYDTEKVKADDKMYGDLHECCKYPRKP
jgi:copper chaperone CopZ